MSSNKQNGGGRPVDARKMLGVLRATKSRQDVTAQPGRGRGLWLSTKLWLALTRYLEQQAAEVDALQQALVDKEQEAEQLRQQVEAERLERRRAVEELQAQATQLRAQVEQPLAELGALRTQMRHKQDTWDKQKYDLETQMDRLMGVLRNMGLLADSEGQRLASAPSPPGVHHDFMQVGSSLTAPEAQALQVRELSMLLAEARHQAEAYRRQLAMRSVPAEEMALDMRRLKADNQRLVALLAKVPEYRTLAAEVAAESGVHYIPLEECLMMRGLVEQLHPQMTDRPVQEVAGRELAGTGRRRDPDGDDPALTLVLDEQYHWVPRQALLTGAALMRRMMPALPMSQLLVLVAELNKVWRDRERQRLAEVAAVHREELRRVQHTFQQRAPYEAVVAGQKLNDIKRRMRAQAAQAAAAAAAAKGEQRRVEDDSKVMLHAGLSSIQDLSRQVARLVTRNKKLAGKAARQQRALAAQPQPICSVCLDRILLPNTLGAPPRTGMSDEHQQQGRADAAAAAQPNDAEGDAAAAGTRYHDGGPYGYMDPYAAAPSPPSLGGVNGYDEYGAQRTGGVDFGPSLAAQLGPAVPTFNLSARAIADPTANTEPYSSGTVVRVNVVPPPRPPQPQPASPSAVRAREAAAASARPTAPSAAAAGPAAAAHGAALDGSGTALMRLHLGPAFASVAGPDADAPYFGAGAQAPGGAVSSSGGAGATAAPGAAVELSTASLADWRTGATTTAPITVQVQVAGSSPARTVVLRGGAQAGDPGGGGGGGGATQLVQVQQQARGVPVRVRVRFPRQDLTMAQQ